MKIKNILLINCVLGLLSFWCLIKPSMVSAQYQVLGESKIGLSIDKKVKSSDMSQFYDNISASTFLFKEGSTIEFQVKVENTGDLDLQNIKVSDSFPHHLSWQFYPGSIEGNSINWTIDRLTPGESKSFLLRALIKTEPKFSLGQQINRVIATVNNMNDTDTALYFIEKPVVPVTGDTSATIKIAVLVSIIGSGIIIRKIARGY